MIKYLTAAIPSQVRSHTRIARKLDDERMQKQVAQDTAKRCEDENTRLQKQIIVLESTNSNLSQRVVQLEKARSYHHTVLGPGGSQYAAEIPDQQQQICQLLAERNGLRCACGLISSSHSPHSA
eukprot:SAG31_NODE_1499_length_8091_cov_2.089590_1_plen_124_part_00